MLGNIHSIETFGSADGPGVRYLIFLKGCNMRCKYCHNPDTWAKTEGEMKSAEEILQQALRYKRYWGKKGGITVSGGEAPSPIDFVGAVPPGQTAGRAYHPGYRRPALHHRGTVLFQV